MSYVPDPSPAGPWDEPDEDFEHPVPGVFFADGPEVVGRLWVVEEVGSDPVEYTLYDRTQVQFGFCKGE